MDQQMQLQVQLQLQLQRQRANNHPQQQQCCWIRPPNFTFQQPQHPQHPQHVSPSSSDVIAQALSQLSLQQRDAVYADIHGIVDANIAEDPQHVAQCLALLEHELTLLTSNNMECAYQKALLIEQDQRAAVTGSAGYSASTKRTTAAATIALEGAAGSCSYVQGDDFRLMFLRADEWNVKLAAKRMIGFLELKLKLFGMEKLCRDIVLDDLKEGDDGDWNYVKCGYFQQIPLKDRSGRTILMVWPQFPMEYTAQNVVRSVT
jgi:hypothetical protein